MPPCTASGTTYLREWILTRGVHIALVIGFVLLTTRVIR
jgi:hypothetical protein